MFSQLTCLPLQLPRIIVPKCTKLVQDLCTRIHKKPPTFMIEGLDECAEGDSLQNCRENEETYYRCRFRYYA